MIRNTDDSKDKKRICNESFFFYSVPQQFILFSGNTIITRLLCILSVIFWMCVYKRVCVCVCELFNINGTYLFSYFEMIHISI